MTHPPPDLDRLRQRRALNDRMRKAPLDTRFGRLVIAPAVLDFLNTEPALNPRHALARSLYLLNALAQFNPFGSASDPSDAHDTGCITLWGRRFCFKIECFDKSYAGPSPDPANAAVTRRVLTIDFGPDT